MRIKRHPDERLRTEVDSTTGIKYLLQRKVCRNTRGDRQRIRKRHYLIMDARKGVQLQIRLSGREFDQLWDTTRHLSDLWPRWCKYKPVVRYYP